MKKKVLALIVCFVLILGTIPVLAQNKIYLSDSFSGYAENATGVSDIKASGIDARVSSYKGEKAMYAAAWGGKAKFTAPLKEVYDRQVVMSADILVDGKFGSSKLFTVSDGSVTKTLVTMNSYGELLLVDGKKVGALKTGKWTRITLLVDFDLESIDVYVNNKCMVEKWYMPQTGFRYPTSIQWTIGANEEGSRAGVYLDNIRVYGGRALPDEMTFPQETVNSSKLPFTETDELEEDGVVYYNEKFDSGFGNITITGSNTAYSNDGTNGAIRTVVSKEENKTSFFDITVSSLGENSRYICEADVFINKLEGTEKSTFVNLFDGKDAQGNWRYGVRFLYNGTILAQRGPGVVIGEWTAGEWIRVSQVYNIDDGYMDVYINGNPAVSGVKISDESYPSIFRVDMASVEMGGELDCLVDNVKIYKGTKPVVEESTAPEEDNGEIHNRVDSSEETIELLGTSSVFMTGHNTFFTKGVKKSYESDKMKPYIENGSMMMPVSILNTMGDYKITWNKNTGEITISDNAKLVVGETSAVVDGKTIPLTKAPKENNGEVYLPLRTLMEDILHKHVLWDERGMVIVSDDEVSYGNDPLFYNLNEPIDRIYRFMMFERPSGDEMIAAIKKNHPNNSHPRVIISKSQLEEMKKKASGSEFDKALYNRVISYAKSYLKQEVNPYTTASEKHGVSQNFQRMMMALGLAYQLTGDETYAEHGVKQMENACEWESLEEDQSWLITGHWASAVGIGYDLFYNYLEKSDSGKTRLKGIRDNIKRLMFGRTKAGYEGTGYAKWIAIKDNFMGVVGGGMMTALLAIADEDDVKDDVSYLLENVLKSLEFGIVLFYPDGAWYEGIGYQSYHTEFLILGIEGLFNSCGTDYGLGNVPGFKESGEMFVYGNFGKKKFNFHDCTDEFKTEPATLWFAYRYGMYETAALYSTILDITGNAHGVNEVMWSEKSKYDNIDITKVPLDKYFYSSDVGTMRNSWFTSTPTVAGIHGGWTGLPHDMMDLGQFVFASDDVLWAADLGSDNYTLSDYFVIPAGYKHYRKRPEGENCLVINPAVNPDKYFGQKSGAYAKLLNFDSAPRGAKASYDLTEAYERDVTKYTRGYYFGDDRNTLMIQDEISLKANSEMYWFMHTEAEVSVNNNEILLTKDDKTLRIDVLTNATKWEAISMEAEPLPTTPSFTGGKSNAGYNKLAIKFSGEGDVYMAVKLIPVRDDYTASPIKYSPISEWTLPEGELPVPLQLSSISIDGKNVDAFYPQQREYVIAIPFGTEKIPVVTAQSDAGEVSVVYGETILDPTYITVSRGEDSATYEINFETSMDREINITEELQSVTAQAGAEGYKIILPKTAVASSEPEPQNNADNLYDGKLSTRYAGSGSGVWFEVDFGKVITFDGIAYGVYQGAQRKTFFDLLYSEDGINYINVFSGESSGTTEGYEMIKIPGKARYIRFIGYGNTTGEWNSITEFAAAVKE